jgi:HNH endonuclease
VKFFVGVTDYDWYSLHASKPRVDEVNFWRPSPESSFKALKLGEPFLFKLHSPRNYIVGGGFFTKFLKLPISLAWEAFLEGNGARTIEEVRTRIGKYREPIGPFDDPYIGCIILAEPFFFREPDWIPAPADFKGPTVVGKGYDTGTEAGMALWHQVANRLSGLRASLADPGPAMVAATEPARYGNPVLVAPRIGQGAFRVLVTDAYDRRCAITQERTLPVLEAAHIHPYAVGGPHAVANGILLRSDLHRLFDLGYLTIDPDERRVVVSKRIREEFHNGHEYYPLHGKRILTPADEKLAPAQNHLLYHATHIFH